MNRRTRLSGEGISLEVHGFPRTSVLDLTAAAHRAAIATAGQIAGDGRSSTFQRQPDSVRKSVIDCLNVGDDVSDPTVLVGFEIEERLAI